MDNCSICREELNDKHHEFTLECKHTFHTMCIINSFRITNRCPVCRSTAGYRETRPVDIEENEDDNISFTDVYSDNINATKFIHEIVNSYDELTELKKNIMTEFNEYKINNTIIRKKVKELDTECFKSYLEKRAESMISICKKDEVAKYKTHHNNYIRLKSELNKLLTKKLKEYGYEMTKHDINKIYNKYLKTYLKCKTYDSSIISYHYEVVDLEYLISKAKSSI